MVIRIVREVSGNITETTEDSEATLDDPTTQQVKDDAQLAQQMADDTRKLCMLEMIASCQPMKTYLLNW